MDSRRPAPELWEQQARNQLNTWLLMGWFVLLLVLLGLGFDFFILRREMGGAFVPLSALAALAIGLMQSVFGHYWGADAVLAATRARRIRPEEPREHMLYNVVTEMSLSAGLPLPAVYVIPDDDPNAFAVGRDPAHASLAVTEGLLERLDRDELQGVVAHEIGHIRNYDIRTLTLVAALMGATVMLSDFAARALRWTGAGSGSRDRRRESNSGALAVLFLLWLALVMAAPLLAQLMAFAVSRRREYDADAAAVEFTRNPLGLAGALRKIQEATAPTRLIGRAAAHLCIADPQGNRINDAEGGVANLFGTHPPIAKRIELLEAMSASPRPSIPVSP